MAVDKPAKVKAATIVSPSPVVSFSSGLDERGDYNIPPDAFSYGRNVMVNAANNATKRFVKRSWLPDAVGFNGEVSTVYYNGEVYYFIADDGEVKYCQENSTSWTSCGGSNSVTTTSGVITTFIRSNDWLLCMNGVDELRYIDLSTFNMTQFTTVADPSNAPTAAATGISGSGSYRVYYGITWNSDGGGLTAVSPILSQAVSKSRSTWATDGSEYLTITRNNTAPAGATSWNLYAAVALQGSTPVASDLAMLQANIPTATTTFVDNGSVPFDISFNLAPDTNSTAGIKASLATMAGNIPVLYGDPDNPYNLYFGALTDTGVSFGQSSGAQILPLLKGTNFYPTSVIGFRNNQGIPNLLALFSGTEGVSKQQIISQKTLTYGNNTLTYWAADDLNAGASSVYAKYASVNYLGQLLFPSSEGITSIKTEQQLQNVLQPDVASNQIGPSYSTIKNTNFDKIVSTAWNSLAAFIVPSQGFNYNNQIFVYDLTNKDRPKWYIWDISADWIGTVSPPDRASFMYIRDGASFYKLVEGYVAEDQDNTGTAVAFPVDIKGALLPFNTQRNSYFALTQVVAYITNFIGTIHFEVTYVTQKGKVKTKTKTFVNGSHGGNMLAGWGNPRLLYRSWSNRLINWSTPIPTTSENNNSLKINKRCRIRLPNPVVGEVKYRIYSDLENTSFDVVSIAPEGVNIGVIGDIV